MGGIQPLQCICVDIKGRYVVIDCYFVEYLSTVGVDVLVLWVK